MIHEQRWRPDTCGCVIIERWDDAEPPDQRQTTWARTEVVCADHVARGYGPNQAHRDEVLSENRRKNGLYGEIVLRRSDFNIEDFSWYFDAERVLHVTLPAYLTTQQRTLIINAANNRWPGKVVFD